MHIFSFWQPGGIVGRLYAESPFEAAYKILNCKPIYCGNENPYHYVASKDTGKYPNEVKIWKV